MQPLHTSEPSYGQVVQDLRNGEVPVRELHGQGHVAVTLAAGRVVAFAFSKDGPNLFWSNPELGDAARIKADPNALPGGFGGDRLWFSPELRYHWHGTPDWARVSNYKVPKATDPGNYTWQDSGPDTIALAASGTLSATSTGKKFGFTVDRIIRITPPPLPFGHALMRGVDYAGIETTNDLAIDKQTRSGEIDLWHLLQMPAGSILIVPLRPDHKTEPLSYAMPGNWHVTADSLIWRFQGKGNAKVGIAAEALTGRTAVFRGIGRDRWCMIIRQFSVDPSARYGDHPEGVPRDNQAFQAWDGMGFGEMEYHSPVADAARGPRTLKDQDRLWAFGGSAHAIAALADALLGVNIRSVLTEKP